MTPTEPTRPKTLLIRDQRSGIPEPSDRFQPLIHDTAGELHLSHEAQFSLFLSCTESARLNFRFRAKRPCTAHPDGSCGAFTAELWKYDCGEFFLANPATGRYLEFNLSPQGAWWSASFNAPRDQDSEERFHDVSCSSSPAAQDHWDVSISVPLEIIENTLGCPISDATGNVTAILSTPEQIFLSHAPLGGEQPDFHRPSDWLPIQID